MWLVPPSRKFSLLSLKAVNNFIPSGTATLSGCLRCCRGSRALLGELGKSQTETSLVMVEPKELSHGLLPLTSRVRKGTARCDPHVSLDTGSAVPPARGCPQEMTEETLLLHLVAVEQSWDGDSTGMEPAGERPGERRQCVGCAPPEPPSQHSWGFALLGHRLLAATGVCTLLGSSWRGLAVRRGTGQG